MILQNSPFTFFPSSAFHSKREEDDKPVVPPKTEADANVRDDKKDAKLSSAAPSGSADSKDDKVRTDVCLWLHDSCALFLNFPFRFLLTGQEASGVSSVEPVLAARMPEHGEDAYLRPEERLFCFRSMQIAREHQCEAVEQQRCARVHSPVQVRHHVHGCLYDLTKGKGPLSSAGCVSYSHLIL